MTPAIEVLKKAGIDHNVHQYLHNPEHSHAASYGEEAATSLDLSPEQVFKTLIVSTDTNKLVVAIVPVSHQLNLKVVAKTFKSKKATMADATAAQNATGYILGGISPLGQKKRLECLLDSSAEKLTSIYVSGGKRGLEIELAPQNLATLCNAKFVDLKAS